MGFLSMVVVTILTRCHRISKKIYHPLQAETLYANVTYCNHGSTASLTTNVCKNNERDILRSFFRMYILERYSLFFLKIGSEARRSIIVTRRNIGVQSFSLKRVIYFFRNSVAACQCCYDNHGQKYLG